MNHIQFFAMPTEHAQAYRKGAKDAYGEAPERAVSDGSGLPCRHCLADIGEGEGYLTLAYRPFPEHKPFAETGPIFIHENHCDRYPQSGKTPTMFLNRSHVMLRGYNRQNRIVYGTGVRVPSSDIDNAAAATLLKPEVDYVHIRSASVGCFQCRVDVAPSPEKKQAT